MIQNEREFFARLQSLDEGVHLYEDPHLQQEALSHIPVEELKEKAKEACEKSKECGQDGVDERDCFLLEVLAWFGMHKQYVYFLNLKRGCIHGTHMHVKKLRVIKWNK